MAVYADADGKRYSVQPPINSERAHDWRRRFRSEKDENRLIIVWRNNPGARWSISTKTAKRIVPNQPRERGGFCGRLEPDSVLGFLSKQDISFAKQQLDMSTEDSRDTMSPDKPCASQERALQDFADSCGRTVFVFALQ